MIENNICKLLVINAHVVNMFQARLSLCFRAIGGMKLKGLKETSSLAKGLRSTAQKQCGS